MNKVAQDRTRATPGGAILERLSSAIPKVCRRWRRTKRRKNRWVDHLIFPHRSAAGGEPKLTSPTRDEERQGSTGIQDVAKDTAVKQVQTRAYC